MAAMRVFQDRKLALPAECSLIAQGGLWPIGGYLAPALSTLDSNPAEWARAACELLVGQVNGNVTVKRVLSLVPEVNLRGTTAQVSWELGARSYSSVTWVQLINLSGVAGVPKAGTRVAGY